MATLDALERGATRKWFGYGRWRAPYWFVGIQPGGEDRPELYTAWKDAGGKSLVDAAKHEAAFNHLVSADKRMHHFAKKPTIQKSTWRPLIQILLGFTDHYFDPHAFQRDRLGRSDGNVALIELCSAA